MAEIFQGNAETVARDIRAAGITDFLEISRRGPMHRIHADCLIEGIRAGLKPVAFIGSTNGPESPLYNPLRNPLTVEQQEEQLRRALPGLDFEERIITLDDTGNEETWLKSLREKLDEAGFTGKAAVHFRSKTADAAQMGAQIRPMSDYAKGFIDTGLSVWQSYNTNPADDAISATEIRTWDLESLTPEQLNIIATPEYLISIARAARDENPDKHLLAGIPLTTLDLTFDRLRKEAGIPTAEIVAKAAAAGPLTAATLAAAATGAINDTRSARQGFSAVAQPGKTFELKIAQASCNQTGGDWPRNFANICAAIDKAAEDGADILSLEELGLSAYDRGDDFYYSDNKKTRRLLQDIADYAAAKDPNLVVSVGHPWYFSDKNLPDQHDRLKNPLFNQKNKNFNVQTLITGGEAVSMSAKAYLYGDNRGYEPRWFEEWSDAHADRYVDKKGRRGRDGTIIVEWPAMQYADGTALPAKDIPFGSPVVQFGNGGARFNVFHNICHGKWVGSRFEGMPDNGRYAKDNPLAQKAKRHDITVCLNPNASPPAANKIDAHYELDALASQYCGVFVDTDGLGSSGSTFAQFGTRLATQDGRTVSEGVRLSMQDVAYTSQTVTLKAPVYKGHRPHAAVAHVFRERHSAPVQDGPAPWEHGPRREMEEEVRSEALWRFDVTRKNGLPGVFEALSGGNDSCYVSGVERVMVDLGCKELGIAGFLKSVGDPPYAAEALAALKDKGEKAAKRVIMDNRLTCVFMGTDNSDEDTLRAARTLIEGGVMEDGTHFEGIGGKFHVRNVQRLLETYAMVYAGVDTRGLDAARESEIRSELAKILRLRAGSVTPEQLERQVEIVKSTFEEVTGEVLSYANPKHRAPYENIQARLRQVLGAVFYNVEGKLGLANPNLNEQIKGYSTFGGDAHGGMAAGNAHKDKAREIAHMRQLYDFGLDGLEPMKALHYTLQLRPSAGLTPLDEHGRTLQFDEDQLGLSFQQMNVIDNYFLWDRPLDRNERKNDPTEVFEKCRAHEFFAHDDIETLHDRIRLSYQKWGGPTQAKIHAAPYSMLYGKNVDHQVSLRTPNISANHAPEQAQMALHCLSEIAARDGVAFEELTGGRTLADLSDRAGKDMIFNKRLSAKMWTPGATDGRQMKIGTLYKNIREQGFDAIAAPTPMSEIMAVAATGRRRRAGPTPASGP